MKKLIASLGLLVAFGVTASEEYRCDFIAMDIKKERIVINVKEATSVVVGRDKILFGLAGGEMNECKINVRKGDFIGSTTKDCFFNTSEKHFMINSGGYLVAYDNCKKTPKQSAKGLNKHKEMKK